MIYDLIYFDMIMMQYEYEYQCECEYECEYDMLNEDDI